MRRLGTLIRMVGFGLIAAAIAQELKKPPEEREWHGEVAGFIPYDFRFPTVERIMDAYWNPDDPRIFTDKVIGVGWAVNLGRIYKLAHGYWGKEHSPEWE